MCRHYYGRNFAGAHFASEYRRNRSQVSRYPEEKPGAFRRSREVDCGEHLTILNVGCWLAFRPVPGHVNGVEAQNLEETAEVPLSRGWTQIDAQNNRAPSHERGLKAVASSHVHALLRERSAASA